MEQRILDKARDAVFWTTWRLQLTIPSILAEGEEFALRVTAFAPDGLPSSAFGKEIVFGRSPGIQGLPASVRFSPADGGCMTIGGLRATGSSHAFVIAKPEGCPGVVRSNPAWILKDPPYRVFWGDLHIHTTYSECSAWACKDPEFCYAFARDATHLDFAAAVDHLRGIARDPSRWPRLQQLVQSNDAPGTFVPLLAFESSHKTGFGGDNNAYFLGASAPYFWLDREDMRGISPAVTLAELWRFLDATGSKHFTIPHHTGRIDKYRSFADNVYDPRQEMLFEIYSAWGSSESRCSRFPLFGGNTSQPAYYQDALRLGCRYGVIASSDDHTTMPGGEGKCWSEPAGPKSLGGYIQHGLAAVRARQLTRESLWEALTARNCYGTTFSRVLLDVQIGGLAMGQEARIGKADSLRTKREIRVNVLTTEPGPTDVVLLRNGEEIARRPWDSMQPVLSFTDDVEMDRIAVRDAPFHPEPFVVYYVRVENEPAQTQWSSPIWLDLG